MDFARQTCLKCNAFLPLPGYFSPEQKTKLASLREEGADLLGIKLLKEWTHLDLKDAKSVFTHIPRVRGKCHRCTNRLSGVEFETCKTCRALNINW